MATCAPPGRDPGRDPTGGRAEKIRNPISSQPAVPTPLVDPGADTPPAPGPTPATMRDTLQSGIRDLPVGRSGRRAAPRPAPPMPRTRTGTPTPARHTQLA